MNEEFCRKILQLRRIKGKITVLCEGRRDYLNIKTPQQISRLESVPDANFWKATIPRWWRDKLPVFIPCGGRSDVLEIRALLLDLHYQDEENSYLAPEKLFALVDLDLQKFLINDVESIEDSEQLYQQVYSNQEISTSAIETTRIIITGWLHKEAYFLEPDLENLFSDAEYNLYYKEEDLSLKNVYREMLRDIEHDKDIQQNFQTVLERLKSIIEINCTNNEELRQHLHNWYSSLNSENKRKFVDALFKIRKAKPYWREVKVHDAIFNEEVDKDSLILEIARFYADCCKQEREEQNLQYHIPQWIRFLYNYQQNLS